MEVDHIPNVRAYAWSPDGLRIVYVIGDYRGRYDDYDNTSVWIWEGAGNGRRQISERGHEVTWAGFDHDIYIWPRVRGIAGMAMRYSVLAGTIEPTSHYSIYFSPTGAYYYHPGRGVGLQENVYATHGDVALKETSRVLSRLAGWRTLGWAPDADLLLLEASRQSGERIALIFDPTLDRATELRRADLAGWGKTKDQLLVRAAGRVQLLPVSELTAAVQ